MMTIQTKTTKPEQRTKGRRLLPCAGGVTGAALCQGCGCRCSDNGGIHWDPDDGRVLCRRCCPWCGVVR